MSLEKVDTVNDNSNFSFREIVNSWLDLILMTLVFLVSLGKRIIRK